METTEEGRDGRGLGLAKVLLLEASANGLTNSRPDPKIWGQVALWSDFMSCSRADAVETGLLRLQLPVFHVVDLLKVLRTFTSPYSRTLLLMEISTVFLPGQRKC